MKIIEKAKTALFAFSPNLPNGFWGKGEAAARSQWRALKRAAARKTPRPALARARGVVFKITKISFVSSKEIL